MSVGYRHRGPGYPDRHLMVKAAIFMERRGFDSNEWSIMANLCDSAYPIRQYILAFAKECLDAYEGLAPTRGHFAYEIAAIAASNIYRKARREMGSHPDEYIDQMLKPPVPWTEEEREEHWTTYQDRHPDSYRVTAKLKEALEREASAIYHEPHTTASGCKVIPIFL